MRPLIFVLTCLAASSAHAACTDRSAQTPQEWRKDAAALAAFVEEHHPAPFHAASKAQFEHAMAAAGQGPDRSCTAGFQALAVALAALGETHTYLNLPNQASDYRFRQYPLRFEQFADGLFVTRTTASFAELQGAKLERLNDRDPATALAAIAPIYRGDSSWTRRFVLPGRLTVAGVLKGADLVGPDDRLNLQLQLPDGSRRTITLTPEDIAPRWIDARPTERLSAPSLRTGDSANWAEFLPGRHTLYLHFDTVSDLAGKTLAQYATEVRTLVDQHDPARIIVDLRRNNGGNSRLSAGLAGVLVGASAARHDGGIVMLIGPASLSATIVFAQQVGTLVPVTFIGLPTGSDRNQWGDNVPFELPHSRFTAMVSTAFYQSGGPYAIGPILPDVTVDPTGADFLAGRDPALQAAFDYVPLPALDKLYDDAAAAGADPVASVRQSVMAPDHRFAEFERPLRLLIERVGKTDPARSLALAQLLVAHHPDRARAYVALGDVQNQIGDHIAAMEAWRQGRTLLATDGSLYPELRKRVAKALAEELAKAGDRQH